MNSVARNAAGLCLAVFLISPAAAVGPASSGAEALLLAVGPRPVALGESFVGLADDASAITYNPAGLARL